VPLELLLALPAVADVVAVVKVLAAVVTLELEATEPPVLVEAKVLRVDEVSSRIPPEEVLETGLLDLEAELEADAEAEELAAAALSLLPELAPQVPLDLMLWKLPLKSE